MPVTADIASQVLEFARPQVTLALFQDGPNALSYRLQPHALSMASR